MAESGPPTGTPTTQQAAILAAAFGHLLERGEPAEVPRLADLTGYDLPAIEAELQLLFGRGRVQRTAGGAVTGSLGLTLESTNHTICVDGALRHTWCALDAFGIMGALRATGWIDSENGQTGNSFHVDVEAGVPVGPARPWVVFIVDRGGEVSSVIAEWCPLVNMFEDAEAARAWATARGVGGHSLSLAETAAVGAELWRPRITVGRDTNPEG